jgi:hypothetical protein
MRRQHRNRQVNPPTKPPREPQTDREWQRLMTKVIKRATEMKDPRVAALKRAVTEARTAQTLKRMRIICDNDILREFPDH